MTEERRELRVCHAGGTRFDIDVRGHRISVDQPVRAGGKDEAPTPTELFVASVAGCAAFYGRTYLHRRGLPDRVDVVAYWDTVHKPDRVGRILLSVEAPGVPSDRADAFRRVLQGCLVHNTLHHGCEIEIAFEAGEDRAAG